MKKLIKAGMIASIILSQLPVVIANSQFPDVPYGHEYYGAIFYVKQEGIVDGYTDGTYKPERTISRGAFTKIIINAIYPEITMDELEELGCTDKYEWASDSGGKYYGGFPDVEDYTPGNTFANQFYPESGNSFAKYICVAKAKDVISGYSDGNFYPSNKITAKQAIKIISNAFGYTTGTYNGEDPSKPYIDALAERSSIPDSIISLNSDLTRGEMAEIIYRLKRDIKTKRTINYYSFGIDYEICRRSGNTWEVVAGSEGCTGMDQTTCELVGGEYRDLSCWNRETCDQDPNPVCYFK